MCESEMANLIFTPSLFLFLSSVSCFFKVGEGGGGAYLI